MARVLSWGPSRLVTGCEQPSRRRTCLTLLLIFVVAVGVRVAYLSSDPHPRFGQWLDGGMAHNIVDDGHWFEYNQRARAFAPGQLKFVPHLVEPANVDLRYADAHPLWKPEIVGVVGEAAVLAGIWEITGEQRFLADQLLRIVLDSLTALLVYVVALELFRRRRAALLAALLYALYPPVAWQTSSPYIDFWAVDLTVAVLALQLRAARSSHHWRWLIACAVLVGAGTYFRPFLLIVSALLTVVLQVGAGKRAAVARALGVSAISLLFVVPWTIRNYDDFHRFIPIRSGLGQTLWEGLGQQHNSFGAALGTGGPQAAEAVVDREHPGLAVESPAWDSVLEHKAIAAIEDHPLFYGKLLAYRVTLATVRAFDPDWMRRGATSPFSYAAGPVAFAIERPLNLLEVLLEPMVFVLAMATLALTWRRARRAHLVLMVVVLATVVPYIPLLISPRYIRPASFAYLCWIGLGVDLLVERAMARWRLSASSNTASPRNELAAGRPAG